jgi:hypothetical protein
VMASWRSVATHVHVYHVFLICSVVVQLVLHQICRVYGHQQATALLCLAVQVVGLTSGYHTAGVMATSGKVFHAKRLCQAAGVRISLRAKHVRPDGTPSHAYCQVWHGGKVITCHVW